MGYHIYRGIRRRLLHGMWANGHKGNHYDNRVWHSAAAGAGFDADAFAVIGDYDHDDYLEPEWRDREALNHDLFTSVNWLASEAG
ncbi:MAG: hypothetical protein WB580_16900 [Candidatus Binataceae bacterium]